MKWKIYQQQLSRILMIAIVLNEAQSWISSPVFDVFAPFLNNLSTLLFTIPHRIPFCVPHFMKGSMERRLFSSILPQCGEVIQMKFGETFKLKRYHDTPHFYFYLLCVLLVVSLINYPWDQNLYISHIIHCMMSDLSELYKGMPGLRSV